MTRGAQALLVFSVSIFSLLPIPATAQSVSRSTYDQMTNAQLAEVVKEATGTSAGVIIKDRTAVIEILDSGAPIPVAFAASDSAFTSPGIQSRSLNDAGITYLAMLGSQPPRYIKVCRNWLPAGGGCSNSTGDGVLYDGENSNTKYRWDDTDGYLHPSASCTSYPSSGPIIYTFTSPGWVKLSGTWGMAWRVNMYCS